MPLSIELLYKPYDFVGAFSVAARLCLLALVIPASRTGLELTQSVRGRHV
ncbi:MAG TPA: hypothetical protein VE309_14850 [Caulobacteraceae bacterium]|jgi:ABC-type sulfate transport system permease subunit|nr:hypothetical protein [Caulobacteraceae bacterium]